MSNFSWRPPSVPFEAQTRDGSPFTVWHVCVICQQPRSARYHSEHPVDATLTVSPPQSVCRRCASKSSSLPLPLLLPAPQISTPQPSTHQISAPQSPALPSITPQLSATTRSPAPQPPASLSPVPQPEVRNIPFRYVNPFAPEPQRLAPSPEPAPSVEPTITSAPTIDIMPPRGPSYDEYLVFKRENARRWSDYPPRDHYPPSARDYPRPSRDDLAPARNVYATAHQEYPVSHREHSVPTQGYRAPIQDYPVPARDYPAPVKEYPAPFKNISPSFQDYPSTVSSRPAPIDEYPFPSREHPLSLANNRPIKRRVSFSEEDEVATLPPDLPSSRDDRPMQGLSRMRLQPPNLSGKPSNHDDYVYEKQHNRTYIDPAERPYFPEPKWTPLSESPARELPLVEESYAHGPYRAENSPTPSMQVHVDNDDFVPDKRSEPRKTPRQYGPQPSRQEDRTWTRYVTVKEYRDEKGPFVEVEEKFVFDDER
ncbi:hypothetical protein QM012_002498 [Aureobasidium pullulans]|uniref:Uncharacterized protein n=1 Tax=Aureobasidium pullulans TaxID=5580 RepID=A0ABR0TC34_AURPU